MTLICPLHDVKYDVRCWCCDLAEAKKDAQAAVNELKEKQGPIAHAIDWAEKAIHEHKEKKVE